MDFSCICPILAYTVTLIYKCEIGWQSKDHNYFGRECSILRMLTVLQFAHEIAQVYVL